MIIVKREDKERIKSGNINTIRKVLEDKLESIKDMLIDGPENRLENLRGQGQLLKEILELLK